jgi:hypothetical protein
MLCSQAEALGYVKTSEDKLKFEGSAKLSEFKVHDSESSRRRARASK